MWSARDHVVCIALNCDGLWNLPWPVFCETSQPWTKFVTRVHFWYMWRSISKVTITLYLYIQIPILLVLDRWKLIEGGYFHGVGQEIFGWKRGEEEWCADSSEPCCLPFSEIPLRAPSWGLNSIESAEVSADVAIRTSFFCTASRDCLMQRYNAIRVKI